MTTARQAKHDARELWRLCVTNGRLDEARARLVVDRVAHSPHGGAQRVLHQFVRLVRLHDAGHTVTVASATPLDAIIRAELEHDLARLHGDGFATTWVVDPALIGGMRVQVGTDVYDGSVRAGLAALAARF